MPDDPTYSLLVGDPLTAQQELRLAQSRFVHRSVDPSIPVSSEPQGDEEDGGPDRVATNVRLAVPADGLLSTDELLQLYSEGSALRSAYDEGQRTYRSSVAELKTFGDGAQISHTRRGACEPRWTSYAHYWKAVLGM
jgi:RNA exonuclease NGL2